MHCGLWVSVCVFGAVSLGITGNLIGASMFALMALIWIPSRIWAHRRWNQNVD